MTAWQFSWFSDVGEAVTFNAKGSTDPDGTIETYIWYFGDGETGIGETVKHSYSLPGYYVAYVEAVDNDGGKGNSLDSPLFIKVNRVGSGEAATMDSPPVAFIAASPAVTEIGETVDFDGSSSNHYRDRGSRGIEAYTANVESWSWDFGDGSTGEGKITDHTYDSAGVYLATLTVRDKIVSKTDTVGQTIVVTPEAVPFVGKIKNPDTLVIASGSPIPASLEFLEMTKTGTGRGTAIALADTLLFYPKGTTDPTTEGGLAHKVIPQDDGLKYTFLLRKGVKFWDGTEMKAEDVVYTYRRSLKIHVGQSWQAMLSKALLGIELGDPISDESLVEHIYATDDYTVVFELPKPYGSFMSSVAYMDRAIIQKKAAIDAGSWQLGDTRDWDLAMDPIMEDVNAITAGKGLQTTGAYKVKEWVKGERILLERHEDYWKGAAPTKYVLKLYIPEKTTQLLMLKQGDVDLISIKPADIEPVLNAPAKEQIEVNAIKNGGMIEIIYFNFDTDTTKQPAANKVPHDFFADIHMRKAFAYALPVEKYSKEVYLGWAEIAKGFLIPGWPGYYENYPFEHDLEKAEAELKLAHGGKYYEEGFQMAFVHQGWSTAEAMGHLLAEEFAKIDPKFVVEVVVRKYPDVFDGGSPLAYASKSNGPDPTKLYGSYHSYRLYPRFGYRNEEIDELLEEGEWETDDAAMAEAYIKAGKLLEADLPALLTVYQPSFAAHKTYIHGYRYSVAWRCNEGYVYEIEKKP